MAEGKEKSLQEKYQDSQEFISFLKLEVDHYKKAYEREKSKKEALLMKNGNRRVFDPFAPDSEIPTRMSERSQVPTPKTQKESREKLMAERRKTNLHEALKKYQLEVEMYKSAYEKEKREKERLIEHLQQVFPSTITGAFEVTPAPQIRQGQRLYTLPSPGCSDIQEPRDHVLVEHDIKANGGQIPVEHDEEQDNTLPFPIQETGQPGDRHHPGTSRKGQRLHTLPSPGCSDIQELRDCVPVEHDIQVNGGQIPVEHDEEQDNTLPFPIQETGQPGDRPHPGI